MKTLTTFISRNALARYRSLHDGLSDMIENNRLSEGHIPDDYEWLVNALTILAGLDPKTTQENQHENTCDN